MLRYVWLQLFLLELSVVIAVYISIAVLMMIAVIEMDFGCGLAVL